MLRKTLLALALAIPLAACNKGADKSATASQPLLIAPEDLLTIHSSALASGPVITGTVQPERHADLRAEVSAVVLQVLKENGEKVRRGDLLVRLDDTAIRDGMTSADEAARAANQAFEQAERQLQRLKTLRASGMTSTQQLEDAEVHRNTTQSDLAAARSRAVQAHQQMTRTAVRAPFDGIVSERKVSPGDTAQIGKELVKVIDPVSLRLEGLVSADKISSVKIGQAVVFSVNGYPGQDFSGRVKRIAPSADPTTRQVEVLVEFVDGRQPGVAGLYAEGRIETSSTDVLTIPDASLVRNGDKAYAWRVRGGVVNRVPLTLGERDARRGEVVVKAGLSSGEQVMRNPVTTLKDGQKTVAVAAAGAPAPGVPVPAAAPSLPAPADRKGK